MNITYDPTYNIAYIRFREKTTEEVETIQVSDEVNIDISPDGKIYGMELLNAKEQLPLLKGSQFVFTNESTGEKITVPVSS